MTESEDSQGLKIAVAAFLSLSVILAVTSYFLYADGVQAKARLEQANRRIQALEQANRSVLARIEETKKGAVRNSEADATKVPGTDPSKDQRK
jgi:cell division protein FtsB